MENITPNPVAAPVAQQPKKKKTGLILAIVIPVAVVLIVAAVFAGILISKNNQYEQAMQYLDDGDIAEAIEVHQQLGDYKDLAEEICDTAESRCKKLLSKNDYTKVAKLYKTVAEYPDAIKGMDKKVKDHVADLLDDGDYYTLLDMCDELSGSEAVFALVLDEINASADDIWENSYMATELYNGLAADGIYLEAMDANVVKRLQQYLQEQMYWDAVYYYDMLGENETARKDAEAIYVAEANALMENGESWRIENMIYALYNNDIQIEQLNKAIYDHACTKMETEQYTIAGFYFELLLDYVGDYEDCEEKLEELAFYEVVEELDRYMNYGWYSDARYILNSYSGEQFDILLEVFLKYCGDNTFIADLEAALLARLEAGEAGAGYEEMLEIEEGYLNKYQDMPFFDTYLQELMHDYMNGLDAQKEAVRYYYDYQYYNSYEFVYYWEVGAAERYAALEKLHENYGYGNSDERLQQVLGTSETVRYVAQVKYSISNCLSYYLWGVGPYYQDGVYYLDVYNYTDYTFSITIYQEFYGSGDTLLSQHQADYVNLQPGQWYQIVIDFPDNYGDYWYIDWVMYDVFEGSEQLM